MSRIADREPHVAAGGRDRYVDPAVALGEFDRVADEVPEHLTDALTAIFDRFWQVPSTAQRGLGLGLFISKCIVEAHGGRIWAESLVGRGTTLSFTLPRAAAQ